RAAAFASCAEPAGEALGGHGNDGNGRDRDGGPQPHHEGRGDAGPEQPLRQRKHQHQDGARAGPHADGEDRAETALPAAGAGELIRRRSVGMATMLVMNMVVAVSMIMALAMIVIMVVMIMMMAVVMSVIVAMIMMIMVRRRRRLRRLRLQ